MFLSDLDDDLAGEVSLLSAAVCAGEVLELKGVADDRSQVAGLDEARELDEGVAVESVDRR